MRRSMLFSIALAAAIQAGACTSNNTSDDQDELVSDGATGGTSGFYFLPPTVSTAPSTSGTFDGSLQRNLTIDLSTVDCGGAGAVGAVVHSWNNVQLYANSESYKVSFNVSAI